MGTSEGAGELASLFPTLAAEGFQVVSPPSERYNCITFAAGDTGRWWDYNEPYYWPIHATRSNSIAGLVEVLVGLGFEWCRDSGVEPGLEKVARYAHQGAWTHAAVQTPHGTWHSNMGAEPVIEHRNPEALSGGPYGHPTTYMRRSRERH